MSQPGSTESRQATERKAAPGEPLVWLSGMGLAIGLLLFILFAGPTLFLVKTSLSGVGLIGLVGSIWLAMQANKGVWEGYPLLSSVGRGS